MPNFWTQLNKPIFCLAPMEEVTDVAFREMFAKYSNPSRQIHSGGEDTLERGDRSEATVRGEKPSPGFSPLNNFVMFTEFVNVDGLTHPIGYEKLKLDLEFTEIQRPIVAQIWGTNPDKFYEAAKIVVGLGFDGIDINMGCPQDKEIGIGACAALIREPKLAGEIIEATIAGANIPPHPSLKLREGDLAVPHLNNKRGLGGDIPVSVKTRLGYSKTDEMETWVKHLLQFNIAALTLHARTKQEKSKVPAHWEKIAEAVKIRDNQQASRPKEDRTLIIGNGDIKSRQEGLDRIAQTGCDGVMIARGAFGHPWIFREDNFEPSVKERLSVMLEHAQLFQEKLGEFKSFFIMRKHFKAYASGFPGSHELRAAFMETKNLEDVKTVVNKFLSENLGQANF